MKAVLLALLATIVGAGMVAGGVYGVIKDVSDDDDASASASVPSFTPPTSFTPPSTIGSSSDECADIRERDARLPELAEREFARAGGETGDARVDLICNGDTLVLSIEMEGLKEKKTSSYYAWLYRSRKRAKQVGTMIGSDGRGFGSITMGSDVRTRGYDQIVITRVPFGQPEERPRKIVFRTHL